MNPQWSMVHGSTRYSVLQCIHCGMPAYGLSHTESPSNIKIVYPSRDSGVRVEYPAGVKEDFAEAVGAFHDGDYRACVTMTRSAIRASMKDKQANGRDLKESIDDLAARHMIPQLLSDWAHELRSDQSLLAQLEPSGQIAKENAEELLALAESILEYLYMVPALLRARRARLGLS
jgi:hypothetical protein